jgi:hypothetical protein
MGWSKNVAGSHCQELLVYRDILLLGLKESMTEVRSAEPRRWMDMISLLFVVNNHVWCDLEELVDDSELNDVPAFVGKPIQIVVLNGLSLFFSSIPLALLSWKTRSTSLSMYSLRRRREVPGRSRSSPSWM